MKKVGAKVTCQLFNTGDNQFYGDRWKSEILEVDPTHETSLNFLTPYKVKKDPKIFIPEGCNPYIWLSDYITVPNDYPMLIEGYEMGSGGNIVEVSEYVWMKEYSPELTKG